MISDFAILVEDATVTVNIWDELLWTNLYDIKLNVVLVINDFSTLIKYKMLKVVVITKCS